MAKKSSSPHAHEHEFLCAVGLNYPGPDGPRHRSEAHEPYLGDTPEPLLERGWIYRNPAFVAGSSKPGEQEGKAE